MLTFVRVPWHVILATVIAAVLIAALPLATEAATRRERCLAAAEQALGRAIEPSDYRIVLGTNKAEETLWPSRSRDLICGFSGTEYVKGVIRPGDIFISGAGGSIVRRQEGGLIVGGNGIDIVNYMSGGRFYGRRSGEAGQDALGDTVDEMHGGFFHGGPDRDVVGDLYDGRFVGGRGFDVVRFQRGGIYLGQRGNDRVEFLSGGRFKGGSSSDRVTREMSGGVFNGGTGTDLVRGYSAGQLFSVERCEKPKTACP
jgi:hypothetical protein